MSDSRPDTWQHIHFVRGFLGQVIRDLADRAHRHDQSKLYPPEVEVFDVVSPMLRELTYDSPAYKRALAEMGEALEHHYEQNDHHPEHFAAGWEDMNLVQVTEMLADWKAASLRHADGDLGESITANRRRFGYDATFERLLRNTARDLGWL